MKTKKEQEVERGTKGDRVMYSNPSAVLIQVLGKRCEQQKNANMEGTSGAEDIYSLSSVLNTLGT